MRATPLINRRTWLIASLPTGLLQAGCAGGMAAKPAREIELAAAAGAGRAARRSMATSLSTRMAA